MAFPEKPDFFDLNELECRLLAPRIAFQTLMQVPRGRQLKTYGNIVNVPADVTNTVTMLPRLQSQTSTIKIKLKRKLQYKSSALSLNVRPCKVLEAANWLMKNSRLYKDEGIVFDNQWMNKYYVEITQHETDDQHIHIFTSPQSQTIDKNNCNDFDFQKCNNTNEWSEDEDEAELPAGFANTMLTATDFLEDNER